jgi:quercetin dioxygenase-like cupin family protein
MSRAGDVAANPITGERAIILEGTDDTAGERIVVELLVEPGGAVIGEHVHPAIEETFEVLEGTMGFRIDGVEQESGPGKVVTAKPGVWHDWWNAGEDQLRAKVTISPGRRFEQMIQTIFGLAIDGKTNEKGMPNALQLAVIAQDFDDVIVFRRPPRIVQRVVFGLIGPIARALGYRSVYPRYVDPPSAGTPEDARAGRPLTPVANDAPGPPGVSAGP